MISGNTDRHLYEIRGGGGEHGKNEEVQQKYRNLKKKKKKEPKWTSGAEEFAEGKPQ